MSIQRWRAFFICNSVTRPFVHFFPHSSGSTAPYPVMATISIFGAGLKASSITLEGARLSQPDGVRLDAIFTELTRGAQGLVGVEIELQSRQRRIDLSASQVVVELVQGRNSTRYFATPVGEGVVAGRKSVPAIANDCLQATIVAVNGGGRVATASIADAGVEESRKEVAVEAQSVQEIALGGSTSALRMTMDDAIAEEGVSAPAQFDQVRRAPMPVTAPVASSCSLVSSTEDEGLSFFALYRDSKSKAPVSIMAL